MVYVKSFANWKLSVEESKEVSLWRGILCGLSWRVVLHNAADSWKVKPSSSDVCAEQNSFGAAQEVEESLSPLFLHDKEATSLS